MAKEAIDSGKSNNLTPEQVKVQTLLTAARAAKESGNTTVAKKKLAQANALLAKNVAQTVGTVNAQTAAVNQSLNALKQNIEAEVDKSVAAEAAATTAAAEAPAVLSATNEVLNPTVDLSGASDAMPGFINLPAGAVIDAAGNVVTPTETSGPSGPTISNTEPSGVTGTVGTTGTIGTIGTTGTIGTVGTTGTIGTIGAVGTNYAASDGTLFKDYNIYKRYQDALDSANGTAAANKAARQSAYDILFQQFSQYGLGSLVEQLKGLIDENISPSEFSIRLQNTDAYKKRFAANQDRIKAGLRALTPAEYIGLEDQYQNIMRNYGLPAEYYQKDSMGTQQNLNKFIANDVSAAELEDRIATAQKRVINSDVNVMDALKQFYPDITKGDVLAYTLDPTNALENIKRKVTAAEIGGAALSQGLGTSASSAEELAKYGVTKAQAQQGYATIGEFLPTAQKLGEIYSKQGLGAYDQATAESEVFNTANAATAAQKRRKLAQLEQATFGGQAGTSQGALARDRAGSI